MVFSLPGRRVVAALLLAALAAACGGGDAESQQGQDGSEGTAETGGGEPTRIVVAATSDPATLDPHMAEDSAYAVTWRIFEALVDIDQQGELIPVLAEELPELQSDEKSWRVKLREDVTFSDGDPMNADDVVFSVNRVTDPEFGTTLAEVEGITGAEKVDDYTVDIMTENPDPAVPLRLRMLKILSDSVSEPTFETAEDLLGTGPYKAQSVTPGSGATLVANEDYWNGAPDLDEVEVRFIPDASTRSSALQAGEVDIVLALEPEFVDIAPKTLATEGGVAGGVVRINTHLPLLGDPRVRQALNYAIDKEGLVELFAGYADIANCQMTPPQAFGTNDSLEPYPYDPERARELLQEAGADGAQLTLRWTTGVFPKDREQGEIVAANLRDVGLDIDLRLEEFQRWFDTAILVTGEEAPPLVWTESSNDLNDADRQIAQYYHSEGVVSTSPTDLDDMIDEAQATMDPDERQAAYEEIAERGCEEPPVIFLLFRKDLYGVSERVDFQPRPDIGVKLYYDLMTVTPG